MKWLIARVRRSLNSIPLLKLDQYCSRSQKCMLPSSIEHYSLLRLFKARRINAIDREVNREYYSIWAVNAPRPRMTFIENSSIAPLEIPSIKRRRSSADRSFAHRLMQVHWNLSASWWRITAAKADCTLARAIPRHLQAVRAPLQQSAAMHEVRLTDHTRRRTGCRSDRASEQDGITEGKREQQTREKRKMSGALREKGWISRTWKISVLFDVMIPMECGERRHKGIFLARLLSASLPDSPPTFFTRYSDLSLIDKRQGESACGNLGRLVFPVLH